MRTPIVYAQKKWCFLKTCKTIAVLQNSTWHSMLRVVKKSLRYRIAEKLHFMTLTLGNSDAEIATLILQDYAHEATTLEKVIHS